jgi:hypothetical protein
VWIASDRSCDLRAFGAHLPDLLVCDAGFDATPCLTLIDEIRAAYISSAYL